MQKELTAKQEKCCLEYLKCHNKSEAFRRAYDCSKMKEATVNNDAYMFFNKSDIIARLTELSKTASLRNDNSIDRVLQAYMKIAYTDMPGIVKYNKSIMTVEDFDNLTPAQSACIKQIKSKTKYELDKKGKPVEVKHVEVMLYDRQHALDMLAKYEGMLIDRKEITGKDGAPLGCEIKVKRPHAKASI